MTLDASTPPLAEGRSAFPSIAEYAFLSDCETNALVAPSGAVEWMCVPRPDSPSVFSAILDRGAGHFRIGPHGVRVPVARRYLPGTLILETTWQTSSGWLVVRDAMVMGPWHDVEDRSRTHRRAPTDHDADHVLLRTLRCVNGSVEVVPESLLAQLKEGGRLVAVVRKGPPGRAMLTASGWARSPNRSATLRQRRGRWVSQRHCCSSTSGGRSGRAGAATLRTRTRSGT
jgi:hypothetical protein